MKAILKTRAILSIFFIFSTLLCACGTSTNEAIEELEEAAQDSQSIPHTPSLGSINYVVSSNDNIRKQDIILTVSDENDNPLPDIRIGIKQKDIDFLYGASGSAFSAWLDPGGPDGWQFHDQSEEKIAEYNALGFNTWEYYPWWTWASAEPEDNVFQFEGVIDDGVFTNPDYFQQYWPDTRFYTFWVGPQFNVPAFVPDWIDYYDDEEFRAQFAEFITAAFELNPYKHFDLYEIAVEINSWSTWDQAAWYISEEEWDWAIDFIKFESDLIHKLDPEAKVSIDFDIITYFPDCEACVLENWIDRCIEAGVRFDVIGMEFHPGYIAGEPATVEEFKEFIERYDVYGKEYYFWEFGTRSMGEPKVWIYDPDWIPPVETYTEEYQRDLIMDFMEYFMANPDVIGVRFVIYKDAANEQETEWEYQLKNPGVGLLRADRSPKPIVGELTKFWQEQLFDGSLTTDENGQISINAIPGLFEITIADKTVKQHLMKGGQGDFELILSITPLPKAPTEASQSPESEVLSPCNINNAMQGEEIYILGEIGFVDTSSEGTFVELVDQNCRVGAFILKQDWESWSPDIVDMFKPGNFVQLAGIVGEFQGELEIEVLSFIQ